MTVDPGSAGRQNVGMLDAAVLESLRYVCLALAALSNLFTVVLIATTWQSLPRSIPAHFGITGRPDRWGGRWHLLLVCAIQTVVNAAMFLASQDQPFVSYFQAMIGVLMAYSVWSTIRIAKGEATRLNPLILYGILALLVVPAMFQVLIK